MLIRELSEFFFFKMEFITGTEGGKECSATFEEFEVLALHYIKFVTLYTSIELPVHFICQYSLSLPHHICFYCRIR